MRLTMKTIKQHSLLTIAKALITLALGALSFGAWAQSGAGRSGLMVSVPNGYANVSVDDMQRQSTLGPVRWMRVWDGQEWRFNPQWESLSQSWKNLTGSQAADTTGSTVTAATSTGSGTASGGGTTMPTATLSASSGGGGGSGGGCWVWVDEDWTPSFGTTLIGGFLQAEAMVPARTTPFNKVMGEDAANYAPLQRVSVDYASLCAGAAISMPPAVDVEGIRRNNELYLGDAGRYAFNNRVVLDKRAVQQLPVASAASLYSALGTGRFSVTSETNSKGYRWLDKGGDWIDYNTQGQVVAWGDRNNNTSWMVRDTGGKLLGVVDAKGHVAYTLHYTGDLLTEVRDYPVAGNTLDMPARSVKYKYDALNRLVEVTDVRGNISKYEYNAQNRITKITDAQGRVEQLAYTGDAVNKYTAPDGAVTDYVFEFDDANKQFISKITGPETPAGRKVEDITHNRAAKLVRAITNGRTDEEVRYDTGARAEVRTNARGFSTRTVKNEFEQTVRIEHPDGSAEQLSYSALHLQLTEAIDEAGVKTQYEYDTAGNLLKKTQAAGTAEQRVTVYERNALGQVTQAKRLGRTEANGTVSPDAIWKVSYDDLGQVSQVTDPRGKVRQYVYDRAGNLLKYTDPLLHSTRYEVDAAGNLIKVTDPLSRVRQYVVDKVGNVTDITDERGKLTKAAYDALNRHSQTTNPVGGIYKVQYNGQGLPVAETDEDGRTSLAEFDNFLRLTKQVDALGNKIEYGYNIPDGTAAGTLGALYDPTEIKYPTFTQRNRLDERERATSETLLNPNQFGTEGLVSSTAYDKRGQSKSETDANGKTRFYTYDVLGQLTETTDSLGNKTKAMYDVRGNLIQITDANGNVNKFEFDLGNQVIKEVLPLGQTTLYEYDDAGNLSQRTDQNANKSVYSYDAANRLSEVKQYKGGTQLARTTTYTWDDANNLTAWKDIDATRPTGQQTASGTATYDDANRKTAETVSYPNPTGAAFSLGFGYQYSLAGYKTRITWADGSNIDYSYSAHGELESVTIPGEGSISVNEFKWLAPSKVTLPGGSTQEKQYDGLLNLESLKVKTPGQQTVLDVANTFGKVQEIKSAKRTDVIGSASASKASTFSYDDETRLTQAVVDSGGVFGTDTEDFTLDAVGNRVAHSKVSGAWTYDANNRLKQRGVGGNATTYDYDEAGNLTKKTEPGAKVTQYAYDTQNRLTTVKDGTGKLIARYGYDPQDRRIWKEQYRDRTGTVLAQALRTYYLYAEEGLIAEATQAIALQADDSVTASATPAVTTQYGVRPDSDFTTGVLFIKTINSNAQSMVAYYHHDQQGTPLQATDKAGNVVWSASYNVFGLAQVTNAVATVDKPTIASSLRAPGQMEDAETGLHYNFRRYYDPSIGRYISQDPIGLVGGDNLYRYAEASPTNLTDPTGECPMCVAYAICVAQCMLEDAAVNAVTGECNNFGDSGKNCAISCLAGPVGRWGGKWGKKAWDAVRCATGQNSFAPETVVQTRPSNAMDSDAEKRKHELTPISKLRVGDEVLAISEWKGAGKASQKDERLSYEKVTNVFNSVKEQTLVNLVLANGEKLTTTEGHPFKTTDGWRDAVLLKKGSKLLLKGGDADSEPSVEVAELSVERKSQPVFNIEVANAHTYFVGASGTLVHNGYGSYTCYFKSGKRYHGKGDADRAKKSGDREAKRNKDTVDRIDHKPAANDRDSFKDEHDRLKNDGGPQNPDNYNRINSPGAKM